MLIDPFPETPLPRVCPGDCPYRWDGTKWEFVPAAATCEPPCRCFPPDADGVIIGQLGFGRCATE